MSAYSRNLLRSVLTVGLFAASASAQDITYNVNMNVGTATVVGDIVTDGTIGTLNESGSFSNIVNWSLTLTSTTELCSQSTGSGPYDNGDPFVPFNEQSALLMPCSVDMLGPYTLGLGGPPNYDSNYGIDLAATSTQLLFNFGGTDGGCFELSNGYSGYLAFFSAPASSSDACGGGAGIAGTSESYLYVGGPFEGDYESTSLSGDQVIGTATGSTSSTPEPSNLALLVTGIALLGSRKWGNKTTSDESSLNSR